MTVPKDNIFVLHPVTDQFPGVEYCVNSNPPWAEAVVLAFQHYLVMLGTIIIISSIIVPPMGGSNVEKAYLIQTMLFVAGINTLLQTWFGTRLPVVIGGSFRFIVPMLYIALSQRYSFYFEPHIRFRQTMRGMQGALMISSILPILFGFLGIWRIVARFLSPLSAVPMVTLLGLGLYAQGFPLLAECVEIGLPELIMLVLFSQYVPYWWKSKWLDRFAVIISIATVWAYASLLTAAGAYKTRPPNTQFSCRVDRSGLVSGASWIKFPYPLQWGRPTIHAGDAFVMLAAAFVSLIESTGTFIAAARYGSATHVPSSVLSRGAAWLGIGILMDGLWGTGTGSTASVENVGLLAVTKVGSRRVVQMSAGFMFFFSILGKFGAIVASIPLPIIGALYCVLFAYMSSAGLGLLQYCNLNSYRTKFILGFSLFMGLSVPQYFNGYVVTTGQGPVRSRSTWVHTNIITAFI
ncbi:Xanthine/uracil/vitamin C permease [Cynara cardunculus var. scolymus]|uniref:Xanthine/uracil/vitamin C permease n=1 Tax=Cynara cardunculus var. scolymus TaxID=59895 RepID=A0A103XME1_CYNCS|nr:Xanthine/uracil/vitamin C permease [Cynara cardunculus var. scolymus]